MTVTKDSLIETIHTEVGLNKREAKEFVEEFFEIIKSSGINIKKKLNSIKQNKTI